MAKRKPFGTPVERTLLFNIKNSIENISKNS